MDLEPFRADKTSLALCGTATLKRPFLLPYPYHANTLTMHTLNTPLSTFFASLCLSSSLIFHSRTAARLATFSTFSMPVHLHLCRGTEARAGSISSSPTSLSPLSMTFPSQDVPSSTTNSELLAAPTSSDYPRGSHINTNARANSHSQLSLSSLGLPPSPSASTHSRRHSCLHSRNLSVFILHLLT